MTDWVRHEGFIRLVAFALVFALVATWETLAARRRPRLERAARWPGNLALTALNTLVLRLLFPGAAIGVALHAGAVGWGLLPSLGLPESVALVLGVVLLDLAIYLQHAMFHAVPLLWKLHLVHHADVDFDVTTGTRFHPAEMVLSGIFKLGVIAALGPPALAVLVFEVLLNATSLFNHGNIRIPGAVDRLLRYIVVTPDMHRVHHSVDPREHNRNFGFALPWWDRIFGTYRAQPATDHGQMAIGLAAFQESPVRTLGRILALPFVAGGTGPGPGVTGATSSAR
jgi:sterol desaturase/sphingolipid hydroxylase (fatty acid hydroxylase superfamily)